MAALNQRQKQQQLHDMREKKFTNVAFYECLANDETSFRVSHLKEKLQAKQSRTGWLKFKLRDFDTNF